MAIKTAILDDEPLAVELLAAYVNKTEQLQLVDASTDVFKILKLVQEHGVELLLLDIQMPELTGLQFMKIIGNSCKVIITTAYTAYALDGYEFNVVDYLLKPISYERFTKAINKLADTKKLPVTEPVVRPDHIFVKSDYKLIRINLSEILYIESLRDYIGIYTDTARQKIMSLDSLKNMETILPPSDFVRVHKSYIVSLQKINFVEKNRVVISGAHIPIGDSYQAGFFSRINNAAGS
ncbi:MAG: response regulator transcription factor [Chitinophagaceae bacterium]|nr:MAG: response regulator transcription factor [Chitinophagaceae bacterium]